MNQDSYDRGCPQCDADIPAGAIFYRLMIAEHKNTSRWYVSRKRIHDRHICEECYQAIRRALIARRHIEGVNA